jgi:hypothetical protein
MFHVKHRPLTGPGTIGAGSRTGKKYGARTPNEAARRSRREGRAARA